jgi:hypothetical protein
MSMIVPELETDAGICPYPSCMQSTLEAEIKNGGTTCSACGRWAALVPQQLLLSQEEIAEMAIKAAEARQGVQSQVESRQAEDGGSQSRSAIGKQEESDGKGTLPDPSEDLEVYRQIHTQTGLSNAQLAWMAYDLCRGKMYWRPYLSAITNSRLMAQSGMHS